MASTPPNGFQDNSPALGQLQSSETSLTPPTLINPGVSPSNLQVFGSDTVEAMRQQGSSRQRQNRSFTWSQMSIRTKTTILAIALGTLPLLTIGGISTYVTNQTLVAKVLKAEKDNATALTANVNQFLVER